ncbi:MAG: signal peptidase I [Clostridiales bacterium]|nr:signal peptidase I [Clostridiales bacterium]
MQKQFDDEESDGGRFRDLDILDLNDIEDNPSQESDGEDEPEIVLADEPPEVSEEEIQNSDEPDDGTDGDKEKEDKPVSFLQELLSWVIPILAAVLIALVLKNYVIINATVPTGSMLDTIQEGDNLIGFRLAYTFSEPERGDIIIFYYPDDESKKFIKRVIGLPGDTVVIQDAKIYINGAEEPLEEDYLREEWTVMTGPFVFEVPEDSYLVLGDNRNNSKDARYWTNTYVTKDKIIGKALFVYYPFSHIKWLA